MTRLVVAIDGPAGAGKSTVTERVAEALGYTVVDTGALYRAVALVAQRRAIAWDDAEGVAAVASQLAAEDSLRFERPESGRSRLFLGGEDISDAIRTPTVSQGASKVSAIPAVREALLEMQRNLGRAGGVVLEGRDIGTVVFPDAGAKFFLTASVEVRARRRFEEHRAKGESVELETIRQEVIERDTRDSNRAVAPLRQASDALLVDSSELGIDDVVAQIVDRVRAIERQATK